MKPIKCFDDEPRLPAGYIDDWTDLKGHRGTYTRIRGWARSPISGHPADIVVITDQERNVIAKTSVGYARPDVAFNLQDPGMTGSGWLVIVETSLLVRCGLVINAYAVDTGVSIAYKLQCLVPMSDRPSAEQATEFVESQRGPTLTRMENAFCNASERSEGRSSLKSLPTQIQIELSSRCNLRCIMCRHYGSDFGEFMSDDLYGIVKEELFPTARDIGFCGIGEALLHPRWDSIVKDVSENDIRPLLVTNGTLLNEERLRRLVDGGFHTNFSIDAVQPRTYSFIRGASLSSVVSWVQKMYDYRLSSRNRKAQISIVFTPMLINLHELPELVKMASNWDVQHVGVHRFMAFAGTEQWAPENLPSFAQRMYAEAARNAEKYDVTLVVAGRTLYGRRALPFAGVDTDADIWQPPALQPQYHGCALPFSAATVELDGDVRTCCWNSPPMGNLFYQKFRDIWNGERWRTLRQRLVDRDPPEYCRSCYMLSYATDPAHDTGP